VVGVIEMLLDFIAGVACVIGGTITLVFGFLLRSRVSDPYQVAAPAGVIGCFLLFVGFIVLLKLLAG
jgi:drug/metabolite transporter (DMT)-like permease